MKSGFEASMAKVGGGKASANDGARARWLQRFGRWGFVFFAVKGVLWLVGPMLLAWFSLEQ